MSAYDRLENAKSHLKRLKAVSEELPEWLSFLRIAGLWQTAQTAEQIISGDVAAEIDQCELSMSDLEFEASREKARLDRFENDEYERSV